MWEDPIVAEIHQTRQKLAADCNYDIKAFFADLQKRQAAHGAQLVSPKKRTESMVKDVPNEPRQMAASA